MDEIYQKAFAELHRSGAEQEGGTT